MKKRGQLVIITLVLVIIGLVIGILIPKITKDRATGIIAFKTASARDLAITTNKICSSPYDLEIEYEANLDKFIVEFSNNNVKIHDTSFVQVVDNKIEGTDPKSIQYPFVCDDDIDFILEKPKLIVFNKKDDKITIT